MLQLYSREGYITARVDFSTVELPRKGDEEQIRLIYSITNEGDKVYINRIVIGGLTGSADTRRRSAKRFCASFLLPRATFSDRIESPTVSGSFTSRTLTGR